ncbi:MAG: hypothetical protein ACK4GR_01375 [bacterium]
MESSLDALRDTQSIILLIITGIIGAGIFLAIMHSIVYKNRFKDPSLKYFTRKK